MEPLKEPFKEPVKKPFKEPLKEPTLRDALPGTGLLLSMSLGGSLGNRESALKGVYQGYLGIFPYWA